LTALPSKVKLQIQEKENQASSTAEPLQLPTEVAANLYWLGKAGVRQLHCGLSVAVCGGAWNQGAWMQSLDDGVDASDETDAWNPYVTQQSIKNVLDHAAFLPSSEKTEVIPEATEPQTLAHARSAAARVIEKEAKKAESGTSGSPSAGVDLLLMNYWPTSITLFSRTELPHPAARVWGCPPFSNLARRGKPRYIFGLGPSAHGLEDIGKSSDSARIVGLDPAEGPLLAGDPEIRKNGVWWEREPYKNEGAGGRATRFISLANFNNEKKRKWFMALSLSTGPPQRSAFKSYTKPLRYFAWRERSKGYETSRT
jgi:hypothetical protein